MNPNSKVTLLAGLCSLSLMSHAPHAYAAGTTNPPAVVQQAKKITGTISDSQGPIIGATVKIKGSTTGVVSDLDGHYTINATAGQTIEISYVGYVTKAIKVGSQSNINVVLVEDNNSLQEVVVVGYGTMKKSDLAGSTGSMNEKMMKGSVITNLDQAFQGRVAGVTSMATSGAPGSSTSIRVRGQATINANAEPLYVVDGVIWANTSSSGASVGLGGALGNGSVSTVSPSPPSTRTTS